MSTVFKYIVGALLIAILVVICINSIRSFIDALRARRDQKKSPVETPSEVHEEGTDDGKGGASE